jgi:hypothetical protein
MTSGFMFVRIRGMPFAGPDGNWIAQGYQNQYGQETQVVAMICTSCTLPVLVLVLILSLADGLLAASFLMLTIVTPLQSSPGRQRAQVYLWTAVNLIVFSILISLFRVKNRSASHIYQATEAILTSSHIQAIPLSSSFKNLPCRMVWVGKCRAKQNGDIYAFCRLSIHPKKTPIDEIPVTMIMAGMRNAHSREGKKL